MTSYVASIKMRKIRALLAQSEDPAATPEEAEAFNAKAFQLMAEHGIEMAMLEAQEDPRRAKSVPSQRTFEIQRPWALDGAQLLNRLCHSLRCQAIRLSKPKSEVVVVEVFGFESDLDRLDILFTSLILQMHTGLASAVLHKPTHEHGKAFSKSWLMGFVQAVSNRVHDAERHAEKASENVTVTNRETNSVIGTALVLADRKTKVEDAFNKAYPRTQKGNTSRTTGTAFGTGYRAGERADIGQSRVGGRTGIER